MGFTEFADYFKTLLAALSSFLAGVTALLVAYKNLRDRPRPPEPKVKTGRPQKSHRARRVVVGALAVAGVVLLINTVALFAGKGFPRFARASVAIDIPRIRMTLIPRASALGDPNVLENIAGVIEGIRDPGAYRVVIYAMTDRWFVQPVATEPLIHINPDGTFSSAIHLGTQYAVLLVKPTFRPPIIADAVPAGGHDVVVVATYAGTK
jgi:hypothetical protein